ncbi:hypothetical protein RCH09_002899 [Actimicrobium sp. GrIS 1.19]|uniref:hypothetical protein n=1 Tax=Actimicrobium sp. GrIS 1.19 TaxID=3071708 RepID=UPI002E08058C|nr:hypothetical protein [Actimicrobium sp. GrIS 1.19]
MTKPKAAISKKAATPASADNSQTLQVIKEAGKSPEQQLAALSISPIVANTVTAKAFTARNFPSSNLMRTIDAMTEKAAKVNAGDLSELEATLTAQAMTLNTIFNELAQRAAGNLGTHLSTTEAYLRLAFKAQAQCRATIETLAEVQYPKSATFIKQANIAQQQQVNNGGDQKPPASRTEKNINPSNELLGANHGERLDTRATGKAGGSNPHMETVGAIHRASD